MDVIVNWIVSEFRPRTHHHYRVDLPTPLAAGKSVKLELEATFSHLVTPHPTHITQAERQLVLYQGNHYFLSLYPTQSQTTRVTLPSSKIESYSKLKPASQSESTVTYGPYEKVQPLSEVSADLLHLPCCCGLAAILFLPRSVFNE